MPGVRESAILNDEQVSRFERDGFVVFDNPFPADLIDSVASEFEARFHDAFDPGPEAHVDGVSYYRHGGQEEDGYSWHRIRDAWRISENARAIALWPSVLASLEQLYGRSVMPFQTLNFPVGTQQPAHQDSMHFQSDPPSYMCGVWVALEDMDMDNGPLIYYPGSHKLPVPTWEGINEATGYELLLEDFSERKEFMAKRHRQYKEYTDWLLEQHDLKPEYGTIQKGQALLWSANLLHGGALQKDKSRTRHSQVTHYFFEGCRVYSPIRKLRDHIYWDYPTWIRDPVPAYSPEALREAIERHVPRGAVTVAAGRIEDEALKVNDYRFVRFPNPEGATPLRQSPPGPEAAQRLRALVADGAAYAVFPASELGMLQNALPELQEMLEGEHRGVFRDGAIGAIYQLDGR